MLLLTHAGINLNRISEIAPRSFDWLHIVTDTTYGSLPHRPGCVTSSVKRLMISEVNELTRHISSTLILLFRFYYGCSWYDVITRLLYEKHDRESILIFWGSILRFPIRMFGNELTIGRNWNCNMNKIRPLIFQFRFGVFCLFISSSSLEWGDANAV